MIPVRPAHAFSFLFLLVLASGCADRASRVLGSNPERPAATESSARTTPSPDGETPPCDASYAGPIFTLTGPGLVYRYPDGGYLPIPEREVPVQVGAGRNLTLGWSADASSGCLNVRWYRWALDIEDLADQTPRIDEATDLAHWSVRSATAGSATVGPFTLGSVHRLHVEAEDDWGLRSLGVFRIEVVPAVNRPPVVDAATAELVAAGAPDGSFSPVRIVGVADPDGDAVTITVTGITQDEPLVGRGERRTCPDASIAGGVASVRRERSGTGNGRVYTIAFTASDGRGGQISGTVDVCVPRGQSPHGGCVRDAHVVNSLGPCAPAHAGRLSP